VAIDAVVEQLEGELVALHPAAELGQPGVRGRAPRAV
jgi:hypothetical protein